MNIDRMEFISWMERIMQRFDLLEEGNNRTRPQGIDGDQLLDNQDLLEILKISPRSLQRYRSSGDLPYYTISGKLDYLHSVDIESTRESFATRETAKMVHLKA